MSVVIVDYGMGNILSLESALIYIGASNVVVSRNPSELRSAEHLILPGVGHFSAASKAMRKLELDKLLAELVLDKGVPILGVCLGMQLLTQYSTEGEKNSGLGFVDVVVDKFPNFSPFKIPHVGFNQVSFDKSLRLFKGIECGSDFYFTHSYRAMTESDVGQATCDYIHPFVASFEKDNIAGVQFHPELSQKTGLKLLRNFIESF